MLTHTYKENEKLEGRIWNKGTYNCAQCRAVLFNAPYHLVTSVRWPSLKTAVQGHVNVEEGESSGQPVYAVSCANCHQRLGVVHEGGKVCGEDTSDSSRRFCAMSSYIVFRRS
jgi:peptide methionine sulfoxide reductase MsrB